MLLVTDNKLADHEMGKHHPESPERLRKIGEALAPLIDSGTLTLMSPEKAKAEQLQPAHSRDYVQQLYSMAPNEGYVNLDPDTTMNPATLEAALLAAGSGLTALNQVLNHGAFKTAFCLVRPPGHHAEHDRAMGFCFLNNIAICALNAISQYAINRVAIIDFDVHHGNGTENIVAANPQIQFFSMFQHPFYPGSGIPASASNIFNYPLPAGTQGDTILQIFTNDIEQRLSAFQPEIILVSAGFDAHRDDPLAQLNLTDNDYFCLGKKIRSMADNLCGGRVIHFLEGGYELNALARSVERYCAGLLNAS